MPTLRITIKMDNAAFGSVPETEVSRILRTYTKACEEDFTVIQKSLFDYNGNTVGEAKVTR
jgi:hypothetical protein